MPENRLKKILWPHTAGAVPSKAAVRLLVGHMAAGVCGLIVAGLWLGLARPVAPLETMAAIGLAFPLLAYPALRFGLPLAMVRLISSCLSVVTLGLLAALSGGLISPFLPWLLLVPAEASLNQRRRNVAAIFGLAVTTVISLALLQSTAYFPASRVGPDNLVFLLAFSIVCALACAFALGHQARQQYERRARRNALDEASAQFLAEHRDDLVLKISNADEIRFAADGGVDRLGLSSAALIGQKIQDVFEADTLKPLKYGVVRAAYFGETTTFDWIVSDPAGQPKTLAVKCQPLSAFGRTSKRAARGQMTLSAKASDVLIIGVDVTMARREAAKLTKQKSDAEAQNRAKSHFLANMSHELRTPLNSILGFSQMIEAEMFGPAGHAKYKEYAGLISESGNFLLELINDILDLSKIESGKFQVDLKPVNMAGALERTLRLMVPQYKDKGIQLKVDVSPRLKPAFADARAVRQVLFNLLSNALKFTPAGGIVTVRLSQHADNIVLSVIDNGVGISADDLDRLARPFEQVRMPGLSEKAERAALGTGLGLSLVRGLADLQGGTFEIASKPGEGTSVHIGLRIADAAATALAAA